MAHHCIPGRGGGYKGYSIHVTAEEVAQILEHPERPDEPVNEAYANLVEVKDGKLVVKDHARVAHLLNVFKENSGLRKERCARIVDEAGFSDGRRTVERLEKVRAQLEKELEHSPTGSRNRRFNEGAIETLKQMIAMGGEATYLKKALAQRRQDIIDLFDAALGK